MTDRLIVVTPPASEPVTLEQARQHCRVDALGSPPEHPDDALLALYIQAARQQVEDLTNRRLVTQTLDWRLDLFPAEIVFPVVPVQSVVSVTYVDEDGVSQTLDGAEYAPDLASSPQWLLNAYDASWPSTRGVANAVTIRFNVGEEVEDVSPMAKAAILLLVADYYGNREPVEQPAAGMATLNTVDRLLQNLRVWIPEQ